MANELTQSKKDEMSEDMYIYVQSRIEGRHYDFSKQLEKKVHSYLDIKNLEKMTWKDADSTENLFAQILGEAMAQALFEDNANSERTLKRSFDGEHLPGSPIWSPALKKFGEMGSLLRPEIFDRALKRLLKKTSDVFLAWHEGYEEKPIDIKTFPQQMRENEEVKKNPLKEDIFRSILNNIQSGLTPEVKETHSIILQSRFEAAYQKPYTTTEEDPGLSSKSLLSKLWIVQKIQKMADVASHRDVRIDSHDKKKPD